MHKRNISWFFGLYLGVISLFTIFSYSLTDPNLVLSSFQPYWQFQSSMWQIFFNHKLWLTVTYSVVILLLYYLYVVLLSLVQRSEKYGLVLEKKHFYWYGALLLVLLFSYNALSHDVFNYIFNARIIVEYGANPHAVTALEYPNDLWTRFMHNTHTPAPYGYGWTVLSLLPYLLGFKIFSLTLLLFKVLQVIGIVVLYRTINFMSYSIRNQGLKPSEAAVLFLNPLFLIEIVSSGHNDLWMMIPAIAAMAVALRYTSHQQRVWLHVILAGSLLLLSFFIKYATLLLLPVMLVIILQRIVLVSVLGKKLSRLPYSQQLSSWVIKLVESWWKPHVPLLCSVILFLPLLTSRSQYFHPWYLLWSLCWLPLVNNQFWKVVLLAFSFSSLLRYIPWLWVGEFKGNTLFWQQIITWLVPLFVAVIYYFLKQRTNKKNLLSLYND